VRARHLGELAATLVKGLQAWGFVGGQILLMLAPFFGGTMPMTALAEALENPETLKKLRVYLAEGE
jgi:hypothetical protein